jgi:hypothetical protein
MSMTETEQERAARLRKGRFALLFSIAFWILSSGGIILLINLNK